MKLKVISAFRDKYDHVTLYDPDSILEVKDEERARSLIERGLCKEFKGKSAAGYILGKEEGGEAVKSGQPDVTACGGDKPVERLNPEDDE